MSKKLNLSADQTAKLEPILADRDQKVTALRSNAALSAQDMKTQMRSIHKETRQQLNAVLTPEQLQQMKGMRHGHKTPQQGTSSAVAPSA
jgi:protein CpxP